MWRWVISRPDKNSLNYIGGSDERVLHNEAAVTSQNMQTRPGPWRGLGPFLRSNVANLLSLGCPVDVPGAPRPTSPQRSALASRRAGTLQGQRRFLSTSEQPIGCVVLAH